MPTKLGGYNGKDPKCLSSEVVSLCTFVPFYSTDNPLIIQVFKKC